MSSIFAAIDEANDIIQQAVDQMTKVRPEALGLDHRSAYRVWVSEEAIAVTKGNDGTMRYYGGLEYVDSSYRTEMGDWVIYSAEADRVCEHIQCWVEAGHPTE